MEDLAGRRLGGFELIESLGEGAYGSVWRATQLRLDRDVAVKVLDPVVARDPTTARRFEREGRAAASLDHPNIVPVYEAGDDDGLYYLAMRLVPGETLDDLIEREAPLARPRVAALLAPIADALDHAHAAGLVHRDVKPSNILLEGDQVYLTDFGIAASARDLGRYTTGSIGTAEYMSPEQGRGDDVDGRSDLYSLGCVAFHALTGRSPFRRDDLVATVVAHGTEPVPPTGDDELDRFFARALAKEPDDRFGSGAEFAAELAGAPAAPADRSPTPPATRSTRWHVVALLVAGALITAGLIAALVLIGGDDADAPVASSPAATVAPATDVPTTDAPVPTDPPAATDPPGTTAPATTIADEPVLQDGGRVAVGITLELSSLNPHNNIDASTVLSEWVLPVLFTVDADLNPEPSLALAEPQPVDGDPTLLEWQLRDDITWEDGSPVTAADVVATWRYMSDPATNATNRLLYQDVVDVQAVDATTLRVQLSAPNGAARLMFSTIHPVIKAAAYDAHLAAGGTAADFLDDGPDFWAGPYRLAPAAGGQIELVPNSAWSGDPDDAPILEAVRLTEYDRSADLLEARAIGQVDLIWVDNVQTGDVADARELADTTVDVDASQLSVQLTMNTRSPALADPAVRRAILLGLDRAAIAQTTIGVQTSEVEPPLESLVFAPGQDGGTDPFADSFDQAEAERLLDAAGWVRPAAGDIRMRDGEELALDLVFRDSSENIGTAIIIVDQLSEIGVDVTGNSGDNDPTLARFQSGDFDLALQFRQFNSDPIVAAQLYGTEGCPSTISGCTGAGVNYGAFSDAEIDGLLDDADLEVDYGERLAIYAEIDARLVDLVPAAPLYTIPAFAAYDDRLTGVVMSPNRGPFASLGDWALVR